MTYDAAELILTPISGRDTTNVVTGPGPDSLTPPQRAAVERKRDAIRERDLARFIRATSYLPDSGFSDITVWTARPAQLRSHPIFQGLFIGLGAARRVSMVDLWFDEPRRRAARTAHQVIAERRLVQLSINES